MPITRSEYTKQLPSQPVTHRGEPINGHELVDEVDYMINASRSGLLDWVGPYPSNVGFTYTMTNEKDRKGIGSIVMSFNIATRKYTLSATDVEHGLRLAESERFTADLDTNLINFIAKCCDAYDRKRRLTRRATLTLEKIEAVVRSEVFSITDELRYLKD